MRPRRLVAGGCAALLVSGVLTVGGATPAVHAAGNTVETWDDIAATTVVKSGAFQNEGLVYMAYVSAAVYDAVTSIDGTFEPYGPRIDAPTGASVDASVIEAAYDTLVHYFPAPRAAGSPDLEALHTTALAAIPDSQSKTDGIAVGAQAAQDIMDMRMSDGLQTPIGATSTFPTKTPGPGVWRRTPSAFAAPQTPWVGQVEPFVLASAQQYQPKPPPSLGSKSWVKSVAEVKAYGAATGSLRTAEQTSVAFFWTANVILQYNRVLRDIADSHGMDLVHTARLMAMVNIVAADAQISVMSAKYHYLFWRPVTAIDPSAVTNDGFGPVPGFDDGNSATIEQIGWRPLVNTPNHPEYPAAHGSFTGAIAEVFTAALGTENIGIDVHGFDPTGPAGNLDAVRHFSTADDLRTEIVNARVWGGMHYRFSGEAGVKLGTKVAEFDLERAFQSVQGDDDSHDSDDD
jgi:hypothetical protein